MKRFLFVGNFLALLGIDKGPVSFFFVDGWHRLLGAGEGLHGFDFRVCVPLACRLLRGAIVRALFVLCFSIQDSGILHPPVQRCM